MDTGLITPSQRRYALGPIIGIQAMELFTGIGLTLLGSALPTLAALWQQDDARSGRMLLAVFAGSAIGAMLIRPPFHRTLAAGMAMIAVSMAGLALSGGHFLFLLFLLFGTGLGMAMTANSVFTGDRFRERRAAMLTLLNFSWSVGAALSPFAVHFIVLRAGANGIFWGMAGNAIVCTLLALCLKEGEADPITVEPTGATAPHSKRVVVFFAIFGLLYCGAEAALGGWMLTYVHRLGFQSSAAPPLAASCFWLSLLVGRAIAPAVLLRVREELLLSVSLICAFAGVATLLTLHPLPAVMLAATLAGLSMAPVFPICVSIFMAIVSNPARARWLFAVAGIGSASLPWATGQLAARTGSLHTGLLVPLLALGVMLVMLRWPGGGMDLFRRMFPPRNSRPVSQNGSGVLSSI